MTYCLAIKVDKGLVFASDSRTNAGVDYVTTYSKMQRFVWPGEMVCVLLTSGNLATSQAVVNAVNHDLEDPEADFNLRMADYIHEAAHYIGELSKTEQEQHRDAVKKSGSNVEASFILGGQIAGREPEIYMIYPQGNYISASPETPSLQIGEAKYGKPILDGILQTGVAGFHHAFQHLRRPAPGAGHLHQRQPGRTPPPDSGHDLPAVPAAAEELERRPATGLQPPAAVRLGVNTRREGAER